MTSPIAKKKNAEKTSRRGSMCASAECEARGADASATPPANAPNSTERPRCSVSATHARQSEKRQRAR
eukprot:4881817-Pleurochrysis_carterae.AAC.1